MESSAPLGDLVNGLLSDILMLQEAWPAVRPKDMLHLPSFCPSSTFFPPPLISPSFLPPSLLPYRCCNCEGVWTDNTSLSFLTVGWGSVSTYDGDFVLGCVLPSLVIPYSTLKTTCFLYIFGLCLQSDYLIYQQGKHHCPRTTIHLYLFLVLLVFETLIWCILIIVSPLSWLL